MLPRHNLAQIVGMEGDRRIITELNGDDVTNCVIAEDVNDGADRARAEWPWLFLDHLIVNAKFRCGHRPASSASNASLIGTSTIIDILFSRSTGTFVPAFRMANSSVSNGGCRAPAPASGNRCDRRSRRRRRRRQPRFETLEFEDDDAAADVRGGSDTP